MRAAEPFRYNLRFELDIPLVRDASRAPSEIAIEHHQVALVRLGDASDRTITRAELFRICPSSGEDVQFAADEIGCDFLERVCAEALGEDRSISRDLEQVFPSTSLAAEHVAAACMSSRSSPTPTPSPASCTALELPLRPANSCCSSDRAHFVSRSATFCHSPDEEIACGA